MRESGVLKTRKTRETRKKLFTNFGFTEHSGPV
jgi:hypothetical protein